MSDGSAKQKRACMDAIFERDGGQCFWCSRPLRRIGNVLGRRPPDDTATRDRIVPGADGGTYRRDNVVLSCPNCNEERGVTPADVFLRMKRSTLPTNPRDTP